ncbi:MAG: phospholipase D family protein [Woeseiaceae bacterium]|nr:phospholipase D family protein [Woeseiaceae bacterium]
MDLPKQASEALADNSATEFGKSMAGWAELHGSASGFYPFVDGLDALGARLEMANRAESTIDLQYFLMKDDAAGELISDALWRAAERGVRVRFLLDDVFTTAPDSGLLKLNAHPNIEVRLFNPISRRGLHALNFLGHFRRANRRMHNKSFTVDNAVGIVGGRNIADEYYQLKDDSVFADFDVLAVGPVIRQVSDSFDQYWNHQLAIPMEQIAANKKDDDALDQLTGIPLSERTSRIYADAIGTDLVRRLSSGEEPLFVADARVIADDPGKLQRAVGDDNKQLATELGRILSDAESELIFITPYYVPGKRGIEFNRNITDKGVRIVMVTNSLASTNHIPVHSAYSSYRRRIVDSGVELYEVRANAGKEATQGQGPEHLTLHTKLIVIDRKSVFVGSLNLDPRSIDINAEMGLLIESPELATRIADGLPTALENTAYRVVANDGKTMEWHATIDGKPVVEPNEPLSGRWRRFKAWFLRIAPEGQL